MLAGFFSFLVVLLYRSFDLCIYAAKVIAYALPREPCQPMQDRFSFSEVGSYT